MRLALFSDLHLECNWRSALDLSGLEVDAVLLAGDIAAFADGLAWALRSLPSCPIAYVAGNHEYYGSSLEMFGRMRNKHAGRRLHLLERNMLELPGVRILGCTLWSGFDLHGEADRPLAMLRAKAGISDYRRIQAMGDRPLSPKDTLRLHALSVQWLDQELAKSFHGKTIVLTHFAPHRHCVPPQFAASPLSPYFVTDLGWLMDKHRIDLWCYGHTHTNIEFQAGNGCRVVSNQRGYPHERCAGFDPRRVLEI